jgi:hypothetical protein
MSEQTRYRNANILLASILFALMMEAARTSKTSVYFNETTQCYHETGRKRGTQVTDHWPTP